MDENGSQEQEEQNQKRTLRDEEGNIIFKKIKKKIKKTKGTNFSFKNFVNSNESNSENINRGDSLEEIEEHNTEGDNEEILFEKNLIVNTANKDIISIEKSRRELKAYKRYKSREQKKLSQKLEY